ncbi:DNA excision repair protein (Rad5), putative [Paecilomyces variotii No. 5]|uniref:DNA excision repair protein (Rad5), putative n=1 Tax=Byssochlamys spectabilis (strain No. 5 / NBRC 109023) TaxID=1356009 RepID=V5G2U5_BYSSN|nr:DNA excision repair protein (Rad5), putative [Paecilomyces variotii No. 5]
MSFGNLDERDERPAKKRRFFVEEEDGTTSPSGFDASEQPRRFPEDADINSTERPRMVVDNTESSLNGLKSPEDRTLGEHVPEENSPGDNTIANTVESNGLNGGHLQTPENGDGFDVHLFSNIIGQDIPQDTVNKIKAAAGNNIETAVNIFFDASWKTANGTQADVPVQKHQPAPEHEATAHVVMEEAPALPSNTTEEETTAESPGILPSQPPLRYVGAFGVAAWATRNGTNVVHHGESVGIERARTQPMMKQIRGRKQITNNKGDVLTRFTNTRGEEVGRLPRESAEWVSTLIDQKICAFEGVCVYAPDRIRVNDTIYLQLRCYLRQEAFQQKSLARLLDDNRSTGLFEEKESLEEKNLRLRQVALVKLFDEINLEPTSINEMTSKHKKEGLLRAAEMAEQYEKTKKDVTKDTPDSPQEEETQELEEDQLDTLYKKAQTFDFNMPEAEPPPTFTMDLRKYQRQALHWMLAKEKDGKQARQSSMHPLWEEYIWPVKDVDDKPVPRVHEKDHFYVNPYSGELTLEFPVQEHHCLGGILADEMGLGKTIEMLSLIHSHGLPGGDHLTNNTASVDTLRRLPKPSKGTVLAPHTTLVVAPTSLLAQWESEAIKASQPGTLKALVYYGADKAINLRNLCCANNAVDAPNVIITSYGVVLSEYRQTLSSLPTVATQGGLFSVEFFRVILDEAHYIKNRLSKSARACYELKATHRWALTGTPIVNRLEDLFSLVRYLKVEPWSNFSFWKTFITVPFESKDYVRALNVVQTVLEPLVLRRTKTMKTPEGEALVPLPPRKIAIEEVELSDQEREIYEHIYTRAKQTFNSNVEAGTLLKSYSTIFAQILRLRQTCCHPILTRNKAVVAEEEDLAAAADASNELKDDMDLQELIDRFTASTESAGNDQNQKSMVRFTAHALRQIQNDTSGECPICSEEPMIDPAVTACWHSACKKCLEDLIRHQTDKGEVPRCFSCRASVTSRDIFEVVRHNSPNSTPTEENLYSSAPPSSSSPAPRISLRRINPFSPSAQTSAKIHALMNHLTRLPPGEKSVVFSQFTSFLDLISPQLTKAGIAHVRLDGTMPQKARAEVLAQFTRTDTFDEEEVEDDDLDSAPNRTKGAKLKISSAPPARPNVLLISLRAGGVGLNLTTANHVFMMDPWWSFAVEAQAIDRVHRMGQLRDVSVTRFIAKNSIEGRMLQVQERKMNIAGSLGLRIGGDGGDEERKKERIEELRLLFE